MTGQPLDLRTTDGSTSMWVIDGIGNPAAAITDKGAKAYVVSYSPYGGETVSYGDTSIQWQQNPYGFRTGIRSSSTDNGLTKFGYRWQSSTTGGWIERDTLDAPLSPGNANRYTFAGGDPVNMTDSTGRKVSPGDLYGTAGDIYELGTACTSGSSSNCAEQAVTTTVSTITAVTCEGIAAGASGGTLAAPGAVACNFIGGWAGNLVVGNPSPI